LIAVINSRNVLYKIEAGTGKERGKDIEIVKEK
jgi:hypothetical protein